LTTSDNGAVSRFNDATASSDLPQIETMKPEVQSQLCSQVFKKSNEELSLFMKRPLPKQWQCLF
jgi:hypothetical protein